MSEYIIPGGYDKDDAELVRKELVNSANMIFDESADINIAVVPMLASGNGIIFENDDYNITITSNDCVSERVLKTWATEAIVVGYCRAIARMNGAL